MLSRSSSILRFSVLFNKFSPLLNSTLLTSQSTVHRPSLFCKSFSSGKLDLENEENTYTGRQYEVSLLGNYPDAPTVSKFGTVSSPALIYSGLTSRIVGCVGGYDVKHRLLWFNLKLGKKHVCQECGQVFKLVNDSNYKEVEHLIDEKTKEHMKYYGTLRKHEGQVTIEHGPESRQ